MPPLRYEICDVFTDQALAGNALAVFTDASGLEDGTMQSLAREMNLSESAFVLPGDTEASDARIRIFTPTMELPLAGHPTLGTAFVRGASLQTEVIRLQTARGIVPVRLTRKGRQIDFGWMDQPLPQGAPFAAQAELLSALGGVTSSLPIEVYDNGPQYVFVELPSPAAVATLRPEMGRLAQLGTFAFTVFAREDAHWKARVFAPGEGIPEDPATGAAAGPLALHLARHGRIAYGDRIKIRQGEEILRPSTLHACAVGTSHQIERIEVGGSAVVVARGEFRLPENLSERSAGQKPQCGAAK
jgi:trans-2,3-dihydro-3-hydroxyanthranilate isomerase